MTNEPAPRDSLARDYLASERTFLAWVRTSIGVTSLGFVVAKFSLWLRQLLALPVGGHLRPVRPGLSFPIGMALIAWGAVLAVLAWLRYREVNEALDYIPGRSGRRAALWFTRDPGRLGLQVRATGHDIP